MQHNILIFSQKLAGFRLYSKGNVFLVTKDFEWCPGVAPNGT